MWSESLSSHTEPYVVNERLDGLPFNELLLSGIQARDQVLQIIRHNLRQSHW